jgi:hypothetical protein
MEREINKDVIIVGGGVGGSAAALALAESGKTVLMTEEYPWIGGQLTSQAVPPDESRYIDEDKIGCTRNYRKLRENIRGHYRRNYPLTSEARKNPSLNPGNGWVGPICHEPKVSHEVLKEMLEPYEKNGQITILTRHKPIEAQRDANRISSITVESEETKDKVHLKGDFYLDATECGDVLPLADIEYITGAESRKETGEPHAPVEGNPDDMQGITYCFAMDYLQGEDHTIDKPEMYDFWKNYQADFWPGKQLGFVTPVPWSLEPETKTLFPENEDPLTSLWLFRQILDKDNFEEGAFQSSVTLVNWPQNDYWRGNIINVSEEEKVKHQHEAKQLSLSLLYWLQTEAPREDGGNGYPGLRLRKDIMGTEDGLAMAPYVRESRRIKAESTVYEQHISVDEQGNRGPDNVPDSVGIGSYRIDLHPSTRGQNYIDIPTYNFQIPLGSLIPVTADNLLPAAKNIGTTHITNGAYRLHPVEWNIGEASGRLAAYAMDKGIPPREVRNNKAHLEEFQKELVKAGVELEWPFVGTR